MKKNATIRIYVGDVGKYFYYTEEEHLFAIRQKNSYKKWYAEVWMEFLENGEWIRK